MKVLQEKIEKSHNYSKFSFNFYCIALCFVGTQCCVALFPMLKSALSGVVRERKDGAAMPDPQPASTNSKSCLPRGSYNCFTRISPLLITTIFWCVTFSNGRPSLVCCILILKSIKYFTYGQLKIKSVLLKT